MAMESRILKEFLPPALAGVGATLLVFFLVGAATGTTRVHLEITSSQGVLAKVYYDKGSGFTEEHRVAAAIPYGRRQRLTLALPTGQIRRIRVDPTDGAAPVVVHEISYEEPWPAGPGILPPTHGDWKGLRTVKRDEETGGWWVEPEPAPQPDARVVWEPFPGWLGARWFFYRAAVALGSGALIAGLVAGGLRLRAWADARERARA
jgi:hypothetical protein